MLQRTLWYHPGGSISIRMANPDGEPTQDLLPQPVVMPDKW